MSHVKIEVQDRRGRQVGLTVIPHATEWFFPLRFTFYDGLLTTEGGVKVMPRWGRTVPPRGRIEIGVTE